MKIVRVIKFINAVVNETDTQIIIKASSINHFCQEMKQIDVGCALDYRNLSIIASMYPDEIKLTSSMMIINPNQRMMHALKVASRFDKDSPKNEEILTTWRKVAK